MTSHNRNDEELRKILDGLKALRIKAGVTQREMRQRTGLHVSEIETGRKNISITTLDRFCLFFDITLEEFFEQIDM